MYEMEHASSGSTSGMSNKIYSVSSGGVVAAFYTPTGAASFSDGFAMSESAGTMFGTDSSCNCIWKLVMSTMTKTVLASSPTFSPTFTLPSGLAALAVTPSGDTVYFGDTTPGSFRLAKVVVSTMVVSTVVSGVYVVSIAIDSAGTVYYAKAMSNSNVIYKLATSSPTTPASFAVLASDVKLLLTTDSSNNVYALDKASGKITVFTSAGGSGSVVATGLFFNPSAQSMTVGNPINAIVAAC